jgi:hypothetical protein
MLVALGISIASFIVEQALLWISKFESPHTKPSLTFSIMLKIFVVSFINTAVIILLVNFKLNFKIGTIPIIAGQYSEFSVDWYRVVGSTIVRSSFD